MMPTESATQFGAQMSGIGLQSQSSLSKANGQDRQLILPFMNSNSGSAPGKTFSNMISAESMNNKATQFDGEQSSLYCSVNEERSRDEQQRNDSSNNDDLQGMSSKCPICSEWFPAANLVAHIKSHKRSFKCPYCHISSPSRKELHRHLQIHSVTRRVFHCPQCKKPWLDAQSLCAHMTSHHSDEHHCADCPPEKVIRVSRRHNTKVKRQKVPHKLSDNSRYGCTMCDKTYSTKDSLRLHIRMKHDKDPLKFSCAECDREFGNAMALKYHLNAHSGITPFVCTVCGTKFHSPGLLRWHKFSHDDEGTKTYQCQQCQRKFRSLSELKNHAVVHLTVKRFQCSHCGNKYKTAGSLKNHELKHSGALTECQVCRKTFTNPSYLRTHMKFHDNAREYGCPDCGKAFNTKSSLDAHSKVHSDELPYKCEICLKSCRYKGNLKLHMKIHGK